jgi:GDPmannose 4,6-dehydratase
MKCIIFGANGQDGYYLSQLLKAHKHEVIKVSRKGNEILIGDVADWSFVNNLIIKEKPDLIFHLAANSTTSHDVLFENHQTISRGTLNILESVYKNKLSTKIFLSGSGLQFQNNNFPIKETAPFTESSPYAVERIYSVYLARYYRRLGLNVYVGYFFNHESPRRTTRHVSKMIIDAVKRIAQGSDEKIYIGNMSVSKEWTFAQDIVEAIWVLVNQQTVFECNLASGKSYSIQKWIELCFNEIGKDWKEYVIQKENFKSEYNTLVSDASLIRSLGWNDKTSIEELVKIMLYSSDDTQ